MRFAAGGPMFGYMHEDARCEVSCLPSQGQAVCVLSAGDVAFTLAAAGAQTVLAADPSAAQVEWVQCKQELAGKGLSAKDLLHCTVAEGLQQLGHSPSAPPAWQQRPLLTAGSVDSHLQWLARWINPWIIGQPVSRNDWQQVLRTLRWRLAWRALSVGVALAFPVWYRRHVPSDFIRRLRQRFEATVQRMDVANNLVLQRMLSAHPAQSETAWHETWPAPKGENQCGIEIRNGKLQDVALTGRYDLFALSNILDTQAPTDLTELLISLRPLAKPGAIAVLRSLFRDLTDWPEPPSGWALDKQRTQELQALDRSPLCQVSAVYRADSECSLSDRSQD